MKRLKIVLAATVALAVLALAAGAGALTVRSGDMILNADGGFAPTGAAQARKRADHDPRRRQGLDRLRRLPADPRKHQHRIRPPRLGRNHRPAGLHQPKLEATTTPRRASACPGAIVGKGYGHAVVAFPESAADPGHLADHALQRPEERRQPDRPRPRLHDGPVPTTFIVPVVIEKIHKGVYGYRTKARIPKIAGGAGIPISGHLTIGRKWTFKGKKHSYVNARCETGHLQARVEATFKDSTFLSGVFIRPCKVTRASAARDRLGAAGQLGRRGAAAPLLASADDVEEDVVAAAAHRAREGAAGAAVGGGHRPEGRSWARLQRIPKISRTRGGRVPLMMWFWAARLPRAAGGTGCSKATSGAISSACAVACRSGEARLPSHQARTRGGCPAPRRAAGRRARRSGRSPARGPRARLRSAAAPSSRTSPGRSRRSPPASTASAPGRRPSRRCRRGGRRPPRAARP